jgi:alpha-mannosidase
MDIDEMAITVLKNSVYAHHVPAKLDETLEYAYVDHGLDEFTYALYPHKGSLKESNIMRIAGELNMRPTIIAESYHTGNMPQTASFLSVDKPQIIVSAVKEAEDKDGVIIRAYESLRQHVDVVIDVGFMGKRIPTHFAPCEIKTFKVLYADGEVIETNLLEF